MALRVAIGDARKDRRKLRQRNKELESKLQRIKVQLREERMKHALPQPETQAQGFLASFLCCLPIRSTAPLRLDDDEGTDLETFNSPEQLHGGSQEIRTLRAGTRRQASSSMPLIHQNYQEEFANLRSPSRGKRASSLDSSEGSSSYESFGTDTATSASDQG